MHDLHCSLKHSECILNVKVLQPTPWPSSAGKIKNNNNKNKKALPDCNSQYLCPIKATECISQDSANGTVWKVNKKEIKIKFECNKIIMSAVSHAVTARMRSCGPTVRGKTSDRTCLSDTLFLPRCILSQITGLFCSLANLQFYPLCEIQCNAISRS